MKGILVAVALLSAALIAFQLVLMQILSLVQWHHFAYMVISVALLGFGASGTVISLTRVSWLRHAALFVPWLMMLSGATMTVVVGISQVDFIRFDSYLLFVERSQILSLAFTYIVLFLPFFFGALALGLMFVRYADSIGSVYAANLAGSGIGGVFGLALLWIALPQQLPSIVGLLPIVAGTILVPKRKMILTVILIVAALTLALICFTIPPQLQLSEYKSVQRTMSMPGARVEFQRGSPHGLLQVISSPGLRYAPGLSLLYKGVVPGGLVMFNNGDWFGPVVATSMDESLQILRQTTLALPYRMRLRKSVLVLNAKTGMLVAQAQEEKAQHIIAVESHADALSVLMHEYASQMDSLFYRTSTTVRTVDPRTFLLADTARYDLILLPIVDAFGGTGGLYAIQEQYLLTKEAFAAMWGKLTPDGVISITSWMDSPIRSPFRMLATIVQALSDAGITNPGKHVAAIRSWGAITFAVKRSPVSNMESDSVRAFCRRFLFDPALLPAIGSQERNVHNVLQDSTFLSRLDTIVSGDRAAMYEQYDFNITPATDNRPYFSQFLRLGSIAHMRRLFGQHAFPFLELGSLIIVLTLIQTTVLALMLVLFPLVLRKEVFENKLRTFFYFGALGLGYMFVEIVFIQRFILYFGHPTYAAASVMSLMLLFSGGGSFVSSRLTSSGPVIGRIAVGSAGILLLYTFIVTPLLQYSIGLPTPAKGVVSCFLIAPPAFLLGMLFPLGVRALTVAESNTIPWAWGINGCMSVVAAPLATLLAVEAGFAFVTMCAAVAYAVAGFSFTRRS